MKYLKLFEDIESKSVTNNIDNCKDIIETFNEFEEKYNISDYHKGWYNHSFEHRQGSEKDKIAIRFNLLNKSLSFHRKKADPTNEYFTEMNELLAKAKSLSIKLKRYCNDISIDIDNHCAGFLLTFENIDTNSKKNAKISRIYKNISQCLGDWKNYKRIKIDKNSPFRKIMDQHTGKFKVGYGKEPKEMEIKDIADKNTTIELAYQIGESLKDDTITLKVGGFKWKIWDRDFYKLNLSKDEIKPIMKYIADIVFQGYNTKEDRKECDVQIKGQQIIIKIK